MKDYGYTIKDFWDMSYDQQGSLLQTDILFEAT
jgi:hypothetical protein